MPRKPKPPSDNPEQSKRFIEAARELGTDETGETFECAFKKIVRTNIAISEKPYSRKRGAKSSKNEQT